MNTPKHKPFDLAAAKAGAPYRFRSWARGTPKIICWDMIGKQPLVVLIKAHDGGEDYIQQNSADGKYSIIDKEHPRDLVMAPTKRVVWVNLYRGEDGNILTGCARDSEPEAKINSAETRSEYIGAFPISWEE